MVDEGKQVLLLPGNGRDSYLHLGQSLGRLGRRRAWVLGSLPSQHRRKGPRAFRRLPNGSSRLATFPRWIVCELGSPLRAGGFNLLLLLFAGVDVVASLSFTVGLPLALVVPALTSARLPFLSWPLCPIGRRVHLSSRLKNNRQDKGQSTNSKKTNEEKQDLSQEHRDIPGPRRTSCRVELPSWLLGGCPCFL